MPLSRRDFLTAGASALAAAMATPRNQLVAQSASDGGPSASLPVIPKSPTAAALPLPTRAQLTWQRDELALFLHFGMNTFTNREWGDGSENPALFAPTGLDTDQWARSARVAGAKTLVLTAKHHDGFCLWPTATTKHSVASSPWMSGKGDVVREFVDSCRRHHLNAGLYCSPWDRNHPAYGDSSRYNDVYMQQLTELLTKYGEIAEVWFDGANGEGPNGKRQEYDWPRTWAHVRRLQPKAVMFSDAGPDIRWIGNERGVAGETNWSTIRSGAVPFPGASGDGIIEALQHGHADGDVWRPGETDVSIRPGWFYHAAEDTRVKSVSELVTIYLSSVGRNSKLLLNVPPAGNGLLSDVDVSRLQGMRSALDESFSRERLVHVRRQHWRHTGDRSAELILDLRKPASIALVDMAERIEEGQRVSRWAVDGEANGRWTEIVAGTTIGNRAIRRVAAVDVSRVRLRIMDAIAPVRPLHVSLYSAAS